MISTFLACSTSGSLVQRRTEATLATIFVTSIRLFDWPERTRSRCAESTGCRRANSLRPFHGGDDHDGRQRRKPLPGARRGAATTESADWRFNCTGNLKSCLFWAACGALANELVEAAVRLHSFIF